MAAAGVMKGRIEVLLGARGKDFDFITMPIMQDNSDGQGPFIAEWDETQLGPKPSEADGFENKELLGSREK